MIVPAVISSVRRGDLSAAILFLLACLTLIAVSLPAQTVADEPVVSRVNLVDLLPDLEFELPTVIANAGDERLFIAEQAGRIWTVRGSGPEATKSLYLDIVDIVHDGCERGLLGLAFHPQYKQNGYFYLNYTVDIDGQDRTRISRFQVTADPDSADPGSEQILLEIDQPNCTHNGGALHFDPQGMFVIALGDGGPGADPGLRSQDPKNLLGKLLRIDVDRADDGKNYAIPHDNPFIGQDPLDEIWASGLRHPWRFSFDRRTGDLYIGDVGQERWEEVNFVPEAQMGGQNFEWSLKEGFAVFKPDQPASPGVLTGPLHVYYHEDDNQCYSVIAGDVYRGQQMAAYNGMFIYADYCGGQIFGLARDPEGNWQNQLLAVGETSIVTFGEDNLGELYFAVHRSGKIYQLQQLQETSQRLLPIILR